MTKYKYLLLGACVALCGCTSISTALKQGEELANKLEIEKDVILTLDEYGSYISAIETYNSRCRKDEKEENGDIFARSLGLAGFRTAQCYSNESLAEHNMHFGCWQEWREGSEYYNSDNCIVFRRNMHESKVGYYDYKRFLPDNTIIKTDDEFIILYHYYLTINKCDKLEQATTDEKQKCKDSIRDNTIKMATTGISCLEAYTDEYTEKLKKEGSWYEWAIDHDPYAAKRYFAFIGEYAAANYTPVQPVYTKAEALNEVKEELQWFGDEHLCKIDGWKTEIRKLGYKL